MHAIFTVFKIIYSVYCTNDKLLQINFPQISPLPPQLSPTEEYKKNNYQWVREGLGVGVGFEG